MPPGHLGGLLLGATQRGRGLDREQVERPGRVQLPAPGGGEVSGGEKVTMPALGESVTEGTVTRWLKEVGDDVEVDEPLLEVSTDKVDTEIPSPVAGTLQEILVEEDETVPVGADLAVVGDVDAQAADIAGSHLEFEDTTYTLADVQKSSIDYLSYDGSDDSFFTGLGLLSAPAAAKYTAAKHSVKKSKVDTLDADVLFIHFPSSGKGLLDESDLADPFYREVKVIRGKHYTVLDDDEFTALTNLSPLSYPWLLDDLPDAIGKAEQGEA